MHENFGKGLNHASTRSIPDVEGFKLVGPFWTANIALVAINATMLIALLIVYLKNFGRIKSKFVLGLMVFAILFLADNLIAAYVYFDFARFYGPAVAAPLLLINVIGLVGFVTLLWITLR